MAVLPGRSWSFYFHELGELSPQVDRFGVLGPFPDGAVLRRFRAFWSNSGAAGNFGFGLSVGGSSQGNMEAFSAGVNVLSRSQLNAWSQTSMMIEMNIIDHGWFELPFGARVHSGSRYAVVWIAPPCDEARLKLLVTAEVVEVV